MEYNSVEHKSLLIKKKPKTIAVVSAAVLCRVTVSAIGIEHYDRNEAVEFKELFRAQMKVNESN